MMTRICIPKPIVIVYVICVLLIPKAHALLIDSFNAPSQTVSSQAPGVGIPVTAIAPVLGGFRTMLIVSSVGPGRTTAQVDPFDLNLFAHSEDVGTRGSSRVVWNGVGGSGLGGVDLTDAGTSTFFAFDLLFIDQGDVTIVLTVEDTDDNVASRTLPNLGLGAQQVPFTTFTNFSQVDFTSADRVALEVQATNASDLALDLFQTAGFPSAAIPEPSTLMLLATGIAGLGFSSLRRRCRISK